MWFHIDHSGGMPIYLQIMNQVKRATASGLLKADDLMPSVRELATELTINPNTVAKAYQELERDGVIKTVRGVGTFVSEKEVRIVHAERVRMLKEAMERVIVEAHHLGFSNEEVLDVFKEKISEWRVKGK